MTAPPKMPREPFTPPFTVERIDEPDSDIAYEVWGDASGDRVARYIHDDVDGDAKAKAQWLRDRLNAPTTQSDGNALSNDDKAVIQRAKDRLVVCRVGFPKSAAATEALIREMTEAFVIINRLVAGASR